MQTLSRSSILFSRQSKQWCSSDTRDTKRIVDRVWQLVRAGRVGEACDMSTGCGQCWRAATLGDGPQGGPIRLGTAALQVPISIAQFCRPLSHSQVRSSASISLIQTNKLRNDTQQEVYTLCLTNRLQNVYKGFSYTRLELFMALLQT